MHEQTAQGAPSPEGSVEVLVRTASTVYVADGYEIAGGGWIGIKEGRVAKLGGARDQEPTAGKIIDVGNRPVTPGFVNTHHHIFQNLGRSYAPVVNSPLFEWVSLLSDMWAQLDADDIYVSTYVGIAELLLGGCTTSTDNLYVHPKPGFIDAEIRAANEIGFRFYPTRGAMNLSRKDGALASDRVAQPTEVIVEDYRQVIEKYHDASPGALTRVGLSPTALFTNDSALNRATVEMSDRYDVRIHTHLAEERDEIEYCQETFGSTPVEYFVRQGLATNRTWVAHFGYPTESEAELLAGLGVGVSHCPSSNMLVAGGTARVQFLRSLGMAVGLGCDGSASTDHASMWQEARTALLVGRFRDGPETMTARDVLDVATRGSAQCLGWDDEIGHLKVGALADLVAWDMDEVSMAGAHTDALEALLRCGPAKAWLTMVQGRPLVAEGQLTLPALSEALEHHRSASRRLQGLS
ncbi:8-oxoguanine deaminase [Nocardioides sp. AN3]|jgi:cytosine/adenosine deaminase-related metal-dependent hydrolase